jgi:hypothetical protein
MTLFCHSEGGNNNKTAGTGPYSVAGANWDTGWVASGKMLAVAIAVDNLTASTPTLTLTKPGGESANWNYVQVNSPQSGGAAGVRTYLAYIFPTMDWVGTDTTFTLSGSVTAKGWTYKILSGVSSTLRATTITGNGGVSGQTPTASVVGDLFLMALGTEAPQGAGTQISLDGQNYVSGSTEMDRGTTGGSSVTNATAIFAAFEVVVARSPGNNYTFSGITDGGYIIMQFQPAASGATYDKTPADPVGITDARTVVQDLVRGPTDAVGVTDSVTAVMTVDRTINDTIGITDVAIGGFAYDKVINDPVGIIDVTTLDRGANLNDPVGVTDSPTRTQDVVRSTNDPVGITDARALDRGFSISDAVGITDSVSTSVGYIISLNDNVGISDAATKVVDVVRSLADSVGITDAQTLVTDLVRAINDNVGVTDTITKVTDQSVTINDPVGITDTATADLIGDGAASVDDPVGITDLALAVQEILRTQDDAVGITDAVSIAVGRSLEDSVGITDNVVVVMTREVLIADAVGITDAAGGTLAGPNEVVMSVIVNGVKKSVTSASVIVYGVKKTVTDISIIIGGDKFP